MTGEIIRKNTDGDGNLISMLVTTEDGGVETVSASTENVLRYDTELMDNFDEDNAVSFNDVDVRRVDERVFEIENKGIAVRNLPSESEEVLKALREATQDGRVGRLKRLWGEINQRQVTREVVNDLIGVVVPEENVEVTSSGWKIESEDGIITILTWENEVYHISQEQDKAYVRSGSEVDAIEGGAEFLEINVPAPDKKTFGSGENQITLTESDIEFIARAKWLVEAQDRYDDEYFWNFVKRYQNS